MPLISPAIAVDIEATRLIYVGRRAVAENCLPTFQQLSNRGDITGHNPTEPCSDTKAISAISRRLTKTRRNCPA